MFPICGRPPALLGRRSACSVADGYTLWPRTLVLEKVHKSQSSKTQNHNHERLRQSARYRRVGLPESRLGYRLSNIIGNIGHSFELVRIQSSVRPRSDARRQNEIPRCGSWCASQRLQATAGAPYEHRGGAELQNVCVELIAGTWISAALARDPIMADRTAAPKMMASNPALCQKWDVCMTCSLSRHSLRLPGRTPIGANPECRVLAVWAV